ncbi:MAG: hypothetical protein Q7T55_02525 [Solirubrobacteraceae bacterium]|nr:hypothetical protein [Solirubrobacteraceae bacterium]
MRLPLTLITTAAVALGVAAPLAVTGSASARAKGDCPKHTGEFGRKGGSVLWPGPYAGRTVLFGCTSFYGEGPKNYRLGPWAKGSKWAFDGSTAAWVIKGSGGKGDRIYVGDAAAKYTWLPGLAPVVGRGAKADGKVSRIVVTGDVAAWVTTKGTVAAAARSFEQDPETVGAELAAAKPDPAISPTTGLAQGLVSPPAFKGKRIVLGRFEAAAGKPLADSLKVVIGQGEGDECGGTNPYTVTAAPIAGQRVGATWFTSWTSTSGVCS